jgi:hypothetical protein
MSTQPAIWTPGTKTEAKRNGQIKEGETKGERRHTKRKEKMISGYREAKEGSERRDIKEGKLSLD